MIRSHCDAATLTSPFLDVPFWSWWILKGEITSFTTLKIELLSNSSCHSGVVKVGSIRGELSPKQRRSLLIWLLYGQIHSKARPFLDDPWDMSFPQINPPISPQPSQKLQSAGGEVPGVGLGEEFASRQRVNQASPPGLDGRMAPRYPQMMGRFWNQSCWFWGDMLENVSYRLHARYWSTFELIWDFGGNCWQILQTGYGWWGLNSQNRKIYRNPPRFDRKIMVSSRFSHSSVHWLLFQS